MKDDPVAQFAKRYRAILARGSGEACLYLRRISVNWLNELQYKRNDLGEMNTHAQLCFMKLQAIETISTKEVSLLDSIKRELAVYCANIQDGYGSWVAEKEKDIRCAVADFRTTEVLDEIQTCGNVKHRFDRGHVEHYMEGLKDFAANAVSIHLSGRPLYCRRQNQWRD